MDAPGATRLPCRPLVRRLLSVPIYFKILGIGALVTVLFGGVTLYQLRLSMCRALYEGLEKRTRSLGLSLAAQIERPLLTGDIISIQQRLDATRRTFPDVRYVVVEDAAQGVVAHTFPGGVPRDLLRPDLGPGEFRVMEASGDVLFERRTPILGGAAGSLRLATSDRGVRGKLASFTETLLASLAFCVVIGLGLALVLAYILTRPIRHLVDVTDRIRNNDLDVRAEVYSADEIGTLARTFNRMVAGLRAYRREVEEKEAARRKLIEGTVMAQEGERKRIARELHDQVGQSLSAMLLAVQADGRTHRGEREGQPRAGLEAMLSGLIDEVRNIAWDLRPSILDDYGLDHALARLCGEISERSGLAIDYQNLNPAADRLPGKLEVSLYRIAQEGITNVIRHADATRVSVMLHRRDGEVMLLVEDNGNGFDVGDAGRTRDRDCLGLTGMQERAALLGGVFTIESAPGSGTVLRVTAPVERM